MAWYYRHGTTGFFTTGIAQDIFEDYIKRSKSFERKVNRFGDGET